MFQSTRTDRDPSFPFAMLVSLARTITSLLLVGCLLAGLGGCRPKSDTGPNSPGEKTAGPTTIRFLLDWTPQPEHGGFYQAMAKGYYRDAGLDVRIIPGGPGPRIEQKIVGGAGDIGMMRSDDTIAQISRQLPFVILDAFMQRDPQALLLHEENPISSFAQLDGQSIMAMPGSVWFDYLQGHYHIKLKLIPTNFGLAQFMADKSFIQQAFITNEPYFVQKNGQKPKMLLIADSGYTPYRVIMSTRSFVHAHPEAVRAFVAASIKGWDDFINGDPSPAKTAIGAADKRMTDNFMNYSIQAMRDYHLVTGKAEDGERVGLMTEQRLTQQIKALAELKIVPSTLAVRDVATFDYLPP